MNSHDDRLDFLKTGISRSLLVLNIVLAVAYFIAVAFWFPHGNPILFALLIAGEVFHLWQIGTYLYTVKDTSYVPLEPTPDYAPSVDVFITVCGEPEEIVRETVRAARAMRYPGAKVFVLNDGYVAKKDNWAEIEAMAWAEGATPITRMVPGGAKAGNINNALRLTQGELVVVFDADHVPHPNFLEKTVPYFKDAGMGFVQSPQYYANAATNEVTAGAWEQQQLFFGPILKGKNNLGSTFMCGTNMVIRRTALEEAGGMCETNIAEDFLTSLLVHERGWSSRYVPEVLAEGLAPEDFLSYYKQQFRWARGSLEVIFGFNPLFRRGLTWRQRIQYLASASYYLSGLVVLMNALLPIVYFYTGAVPVQTSTMALAAVFLPYIFFTLLVLQISANFTYTFRAVSFSLSSWSLQIGALWAVLTKKKTAFAVTSKKKISGSFISLVIPHLAYIALTIIGIGIAVARGGLTPSLVTNAAWALLNCAIFAPFIAAAMGTKEATQPAVSSEAKLAA